MIFHFHHSWHDYDTTPKKQKPTVGFSARFFLEAHIRRKILPANNLQTQKTTKT